LFGQAKALEAHVQTLREQLDYERSDRTAEREASRREIQELKVELAAERQNARDLADRLDKLHRDRAADAERHRQELLRPWWRRLWHR
jgi:hypothetical protein